MAEKIITINRRARHNYQILETIEAGIVLKGTEVKSLREGKVNLVDSFAVYRDGEVFLLNAHISEYSHGNIHNHEPTRSRKLLLHKKEIMRLWGQTSGQGLTMVPLKLYFKKGRVKVELGFGKGKKLHDKRQDMKKREADRDMERALRRGR